MRSEPQQQREPGTSGFSNETSYHAGASEGRAQVQGTHGMTRDPESPGPRPAYASLGVPAPRRRSLTLLWRAAPRPNPHPRDARVPPRCCALARGLTPRSARAHSLPPRLARAQFRPLRADTVHGRQRGPTACYLLTYGLLTATRGAVARSGARHLPRALRCGPPWQTRPWATIGVRSHIIIHSPHGQARTSAILRCARPFASPRVRGLRTLPCLAIYVCKGARRSRRHS